MKVDEDENNVIQLSEDRNKKKGALKMKTLHKTVVLCIMVCLVAGNTLGQENEEIHKTFKAKKTVAISTVSGDCIVKQGGSDKILVDLVYSVEPEDAFKPEFRERGNSLRLKERWYGSNSSGRVTSNRDRILYCLGRSHS